MYSFDCLINALRAAVTVGTSAHKISQQKKTKMVVVHLVLFILVVQRKAKAGI